jgi:hypothetical protein
MRGGWSSVTWPQSGEFKRQTDRDPVCGESGIWLLRDTDQAVAWLKGWPGKGYCNVALVESDDAKPVIDAEKVGVRSARVVRVVTFAGLIAERAPIYAKWNAERAPIYAKWNTERATIYAKWNAERAPIDAKWDAELAPIDAKIRALLAELLEAK